MAKRIAPKALQLDYDDEALAAEDNRCDFIAGQDSLRVYLSELFASQVVVYDGAMGTMIRKNKLAEADYRGERFKETTEVMKGNNDLLSLTQPQVIKAIHIEYLKRGAIFVRTNTFSSTAIAQSEYGLQQLAYEMNYCSARLARQACDETRAKGPKKKTRYVCGVVGPTNRTASFSPDEKDMSVRNVTFDELVDSYYDQVVGLMDGGADILIVETIFDTLNAKAAIFAIGEYLEHTGLDVPLFL